MKSQPNRLSFGCLAWSVTAILLACAPACSSNGTGGASGGSQASGGKAGTGGTAATGGSGGPGSGGSVGTGGTKGSSVASGGSGSGGSVGTGGTKESSVASGGSGSGGIVGTGGTKGIDATGGVTASGGAVPTGGAVSTGSGGVGPTGGAATGGSTTAVSGATAVGGATGGGTGTGGTTSPGGSSGTGGGGGATGPQTYTAAWTSVDQHPPAPEWFQDAKFGLWHHWGAFCYPAYGSEWYPRNMFNKSGNSSEYQHQMSVYGDPFGSFPYDKFLTGGTDKSGNPAIFAPKLVSNGGKWDPDAWAQLFADAGAKVAGPVAEHHDGFSMWNSTCNEWNAVSKGPQLDLVGTLVKAYRAKGMKIVVSTHTAYNFTGYYEWAPAQTDSSLKKLYGQMAIADERALWLCKEKELIDGYQPDLMWHDFDLTNVDETTRLQYAAYYYNKAVTWGKDVVITYNDGFEKHAGEVHQEERAGEASINPTFWLSEDTLSSSTWGYTQGMQYYSAKSLINALVDRVSKNGFLLLNTSPMADGTFPQQQQDILRAMGAWLKAFGESIYSTRPWTKCCEGPTQMGGGGMGSPVEGKATDIRFNRSKDSKTLYAIAMGWPTGNQMVITTLKAGSFDISTIKDVSFVGGDTCVFTQDSSGLKVSLPANLSNSNGYAVKITFSGTIPTTN